MTTTSTTEHEIDGSKDQSAESPEAVTKSTINENLNNMVGPLF